VPAWPAPIKGVERINTVIVYLNQQAGFVPQHSLYAIKMDYKDNNYYNCGNFGHLSRNYR